MLQKILHFIKYNNATVIILAIILILGGGALAAGPENIGQKQTSVQGLDNTALLAADLDAFNMDFKIENIQQDEKYYYVTYSFLDLAEADSAWQYQLSQKTQKVSKKIKQDVGVYMAKFMAKHYEARMRELKQEKNQAQAQGEQKRVEVTEYSGLIGRTLDLAAAIFPGYEPVVKRELPAPEFNLPTPLSKGGEEGLNSSSQAGQADNLNKIYNDYVASHPEIFAAPTDSTGSSQAPADTVSGTPSSAAAADTAMPETPAAPETPAIPEPTDVNIIELPASPAGGPAEPVDNAEPAPVENVAPAEPAPVPGQ